VHSTTSTHTTTVTSTDHHGGHGQRTLADYLEIVRRRKWAVIVPFLLVPIVAYVYAAQQPASYAAASEVLLSRQDLGSALSGITNADVFTDADRFATTQAALARVPEVARRAVERSRVSGADARDLLLNSTVRPRGNADLLEFTVQDPDPRIAAVLSAAYAAAYADYRLELDTAALATARRDLLRTLSALERSGQTDTSLYRELTQKVQELRTMELLQTRAEVVKTSETGSQVAPTPRRNAMLGAALGLLLGLAAVFVWEALDRRVRDEDEVQRTLGLPLLARLPAPRSARLAMLDDPSDVNAEAVRRLRTSIEFANLDVRAKILMITSSVGNEGKTTTLSNLAVALARAGQRVALVDLDLRKPMVGSMFGVELRPGLADVAIGRIELERALVPIALRPPEPARLTRRSRGVGVQDDAVARGHSTGELYVLPAGFLPANPGELVGTQAVAGILSSLREEMDFVLVDSPPLLTVSDAAALSTRVDAIAVVVRLGVINRPMLRDLARELDASPATKLGFVLTGVGSTELYGTGAYAYRSAPETSGQHAPEVVPAAPEIDESIDERRAMAARRQSSPRS
jgi:Mrp family chromosome partitioning ATPase